MIIKLSPVRSDDVLYVAVHGETLQINDLAFDFSGLPDGADLPPGAVDSPCFVDIVGREGGQLSVTLRLPHAADAPDEARFPVDIVEPVGPVALPGLELAEAPPVIAGIIDWSQMVTAEQKALAAAERLLSAVVAETARHRAAADAAIAPLQDAVDLDEATPAEAALLKDWKRYRIALNRLPEQPGYPAEIDWPAPPA